MNVVQNILVTFNAPIKGENEKMERLEHFVHLKLVNIREW